MGGGHGTARWPPRGYSRDGKAGKDQIEYGLTCDPEGRPIAVEVFAGNTADPTAFISAAATVRDRFGLDEVVMVGDRGMITSARIEALKSRGRPRLDHLPAGPGDQGPGRGRRTAAEPLRRGQPGRDHPPRLPRRAPRRLPQPGPGRRAGPQAPELLAATEADLAPIEAAVERDRRARPRPRQDRPARRQQSSTVTRWPSTSSFTIGEDHFSFARKTDQIAAEAALDGIYVIRASAAHTADLDAARVVEAYKDLKFNEAGFRSLKTIDLDLRPIHHCTEPRVRAHVFICMLALYLVWHLRKAWAPICFTDEAPPERDRPRRPRNDAPPKR